MATDPVTAAAVVSPFLACIGSPCLRHCVHGASIGGGGGPRAPGGHRSIGSVEYYSVVDHHDHRMDSRMRSPPSWFSPRAGGGRADFGTDEYYERVEHASELGARPQRGRGLAAPIVDHGL
jgi:hypothetical protein